MITMKSRTPHPAGWLLAGAAALFLTAVIAVRANPDPQGATETAAADATAGIGAQVTDRIGDHFVTFAGSETNADALVTGLHDGSAINLTATSNGQATTTTFTPDAAAMSYRNAFLALALAEAQLTKLGITDPTPAQIEAALNGGSVTSGAGSTATTTQLTGVLVLHGQKQDWSQVATTLGVDLHTAVTAARVATDAGETAEAGQADEMTRAQARLVDRLSDRYTTFAGSETNATALVNGLRDGTAITLTSAVNGQTTTTTFTPTTGAMGYGNVAVALSLAQQDLAKAGVTDPTPAEIEAALNGGSITTGTGSAAVTTPLSGVLALRTQGQGWGQIAQTLGVNLHPHWGADMAAHAMVAAEHPEFAAAAAHADTVAAVHPNVPAPMTVRVPDGAAAHPQVPPMVHFERPEIPARPMLPGHR